MGETTASNRSFASSPPRTDCHATNSLVDLRGALAFGFFLNELLGNEEPGACLLLGCVANLRQTIGEIRPSLAQVSCDSNGIDNVSVFICVQQLAAASECVVDLLSRACFIIVKREKFAKLAPEIQLALQELIWGVWRGGSIHSHRP